MGCSWQLVGVSQWCGISDQSSALPGSVPSRRRSPSPKSIWSPMAHVKLATGYRPSGRCWLTVIAMASVSVSPCASVTSTVAV